jgi:hypothetical protein
MAREEIARRRPDALARLELFALPQSYFLL